MGQEIGLDTFRTFSNLPNLGGRPAGAASEGTVARGEVDGRTMFGVNSGSDAYTSFDRDRADALREVMLRKYPLQMNLKNIGGKPNDALYHAEATSLLRLAKRFGGSLKGKKITIATDRRLCPSCDGLLPKIVYELGNPEVTISDPFGSNKTTSGGQWSK